MISNQFDLTGKVALITGGAGLLGLQHAAALLDIGATVVLADLSLERIESAAIELKREFDSGRLIPLELDVTNPVLVSQASEQLMRRNLPVHCLINNAAINPAVNNRGDLCSSSRLENFSLEEWNKQVNVGLTGAFVCSQVFGSAMADRGNGGVILNISSDLSVIAPDQRLYFNPQLLPSQQVVKPVTYSVIKSGLVGLTRYLASYWAENGIRSNALSPGGVFDGQPQEFVEKISGLIPMGRMAQKSEYRAAVQFLCSDASSYMTGQNIVIDGGRSVI